MIMKNPFFKLITLFAAALLITSCSESAGGAIPSQNSDNQRLKIAARSITSPNATTTNPNNLNHSSDLIDSFDCFELVFPLQVTDGTQNTTINNEDELYNFYNSLPTTATPNFIFPIKIILADNTEKTIQNIAELTQEAMNCFQDIKDCFTLNFPLTVTDGKGNNTTVNSEQELFNFYNGLSMDAEPNFVYPITVTKTADNSVVTINNDEEFDTLYEECFDFEDCDMGDFSCFDIKYPIQATSTASGQITINSDDELDTYFDGLADTEDPQFTFPITIIFSDNTEKMINSLLELEEEFDACYDETIEIDDCFTFNYPITLVKQDNTTVSVASDADFDTFIDSLADDEDFNFQYPFNVTLKNGQIQSVNNEDAFYKLFDNCQ